MLRMFVKCPHCGESVKVELSAHVEEFKGKEKQTEPAKPEPYTAEQIARARDWRNG